MKRREVIRLVSLATGAAISAPLMSSLVTGCKKVEKIPDLDYTLQFFNQNEFSLIRTVIDIILPKTDSPSATDVGVHKTIDTMVGNVYRPHEKENYTKRISLLLKYLDGFLKLSNKKQIETIQQLSISNKSENKAVKDAFLELKQQTIAYYLLTEEIATKFLNYLPVPGKYEPCITLEETGGKAWAI